MNNLFVGSVFLLVFISGTFSADCKKGDVINDYLGQRRVCHGGKMIGPCRVRREWQGLLLGERYRFIHTLKNASTRQDYKDLVTKHTYHFSHIHNSLQFLAWHRWYLLQMENILRKVDPIVTIPYWDWSLWSGAPWFDKHTSGQMMRVWSEAPWGFGIDGGRDGCVYSGPFGSREQWRQTDDKCLKRKFNGNPPDCIAVHKCLRFLHHEFEKFESTIRETLHNNMHCRIGGTMCSRDSANAPEFLLHHSFTDKIWADWKKKDSKYMNASLNDSVQLYGLEPTLTPRDLMDLLKQPGNVCVIYDDPPHAKYELCHTTLASLTPDEIDAIPRHRFSRVSHEEFTLFVMKKKARERAQAEMKIIEPKHVLPKSTKLNAQDSQLGFKVEDVEAAVRKRKREMLLAVNKWNNNPASSLF